MRILLGLLLCLLPAYADKGISIYEHGRHEMMIDNAQPGEHSPMLTGKFGLVSDYISRGQTQAFGEPAV